MQDSPNVRRRSNRNGDVGRSGYFTIEDEDLAHSGIRGGRSCCLCTVIVILFLVAILNALVTAGLIYFLSITHEGMTDVEFLPDSKYIRVLSDLSVEDLTLHEQLTGRSGKDLNINGDKVTVGVVNGAQVTVEGNKTYITSSEFELRTSDGVPMFKTSSPLTLDLYQVKNLHAPAVDVGAVTSSRNFPDLLIESFHDAEIVGMEGVEVDTKGNVEIVAADNDILVNSLHESLEFDSEEGIFLNPDLPLDGKGSLLSMTGDQYKLCVCGSNGKVFAVPDLGPMSGCHLANEDKNPCEE